MLGVSLTIPRTTGRAAARFPILRALVTSVVLLALVMAASPAVAQSTAINGTIEGTILDASGGVMPGVTVTMTNAETGAQRVVVTNERGVYRAPLLPLGTYTLVAELSGFRRYEQRGITLSAGQTAVVNITLTVGEVSETVTVTAEAPVVDAGKIDLGRNLGEREVKNLPLVSRNPYNFALLQPGVTGYENPEFGVPRFSANGTLLRINYQVDGNTNTQKDRAGLRLIPMSEVMIREVKVVTSGYAPEFGQTTGMVYNAITPSGTNTFKGTASYRFRRKNFSAFPFFFQGAKTPERKPDTKINTWTGDFGGPIVKDRLHFFFGYENTYRDLSSQRIIQIDPAAAQQIGLAPQPAYVPWTQTAQFIIGKLDYQLTPANRLTGRYIRFTNDSPGNGGGGLSAIETTLDFLDAMNSAAVQMVSTMGNNKLNEIRVQYANRHTSRFLSPLSGTGTTVTITGVASFGRPFDSPEDFKQGILQFIENFSWIRGSHSFKFGVDAQVVWDSRAASFGHRYTFPTIAAYLAAKNGTNPYGYTSFSQQIGDPNFKMTSHLYSAFAQDDWRLTPDLKMLYGLRYDLYVYPKANPDSPFEYSKQFHVDKNNLAPRVGIAWNVGRDRRTVVRASTGIMYDQAMLGAYTNAIEQNGLPARVTVSLNPAAAGAPAFPQTLKDLPPGYTLPAQNIFVIDPNFRVARTIQNNVQVERGLGKSYSVSVGVVYVRGYDLPVVNNINLINPVGTLADGRPIFSGAVNANTRMDPRFNQINCVQSVGQSTYKGMTVQVGRRARGLQFDLSYTLGKGIDNAPTNSNLSFVSDAARSDPTNLDRDKGPNLLDIRHNFAGSVVANPTVNVENAILRTILNDNQVGLMLQFNSGLPFNITSNRDLNVDGNGSDRPLNVGRNAGRMPARWNVDLRYSRFVRLRHDMRLEIIGEFKNVLNTVQVSGVLSSVQVDTQGNPLSPIPTFVNTYGKQGGFQPSSGYEQRAFQLGFKFHFR